MKFIIAAQLFWPIWILFRSVGLTWLGMAFGALVVFMVFGWMWKQEFGTWKFWTDV